MGQVTCFREGDASAERSSAPASPGNGGQGVTAVWVQHPPHALDDQAPVLLTLLFGFGTLPAPYSSAPASRVPGLADAGTSEARSAGMAGRRSSSVSESGGGRESKPLGTAASAAPGGEICGHGGTPELERLVRPGANRRSPAVRASPDFRPFSARPTEDPTQQAPREFAGDAPTDAPSHPSFSDSLHVAKRRAKA